MNWRHVTGMGLAIVVGFASALAAQATALPSERAVRALTRQAESRAHGDATALVLDLDRRVRAQWGEFESFPISVVRRDDLVITLTTPYMGYRRSLANYLKIGRRAADVPWVDAVVIAVSPGRIGAPDVREVVVTRGGAAVAPLKSALRPMAFTDGSGAKGVLTAGEVHFPMSAFAPGAAVVVTAQPESGEAFVLELGDGELRVLR